MGEEPSPTQFTGTGMGNTSDGEFPLPSLVLLEPNRPPRASFPSPSSRSSLPFAAATAGPFVTFTQPALAPSLARSIAVCDEWAVYRRHRRRPTPGAEALADLFSGEDPPLMQAARRLASWSRPRRLLLPYQAQGPSIPTAAAFLHSHATSFGYKQVREEEKSKLVGNVFSSVASSYDLMNDLMSVGLHRLWKDRLISNLNPFPGMKHLDVAGGTGDVAFRVLERIKSVSHRAMQGTLTETEEDTHIYVCDINPNMLNVGKKRAAERGYSEEHCLSWIQGDAEALTFEDGSMDGYTIAFGIRNVTHIEKALSEAYRVLKRGGRFLCLELSHVDVPVFKEIYDVYSFSVIPTVGELVAGDRQSYQYLVESIRRFPNQEKFAQMIQEAGFQRVEYENLVGGVVAIHSGLKL